MMAIRLLSEVLLFTILLPIRVLILVYAIGYIGYCKAKGYLTVREGFETLFKGMLKTLKLELYWIKTGDFE